MDVAVVSFVAGLIVQRCMHKHVPLFFYLEFGCKLLTTMAA
jgi:hypothetical protein